MNFSKIRNFDPQFLSIFSCPHMSRIWIIFCYRYRIEVFKFSQWTVWSVLEGKCEEGLEKSAIPYTVLLYRTAIPYSASASCTLNNIKSVSTSLQSNLRETYRIPVHLFGRWWVYVKVHSEYLTCNSSKWRTSEIFTRGIYSINYDVMSNIIST